jgi:hypothetical protein
VNLNARVITWATGQHLVVSRVVTEVRSALNGRRTVADWATRAIDALGADQS